MISRMFIAMIVISGSACTSDHETTTPDPLQIGTCTGQKTDAYYLGDLAIQGDELLVHVETGGGCASHRFSMCWDGAVLDSNPPQVNLVLSHDAHGDTCDALLFHDLRVDLTRIRASVEPPVTLHVSGAATEWSGRQGTVYQRWEGVIRPAARTKSEPHTTEASG